MPLYRTCLGMIAIAFVWVGCSEREAKSRVSGGPAGKSALPVVEAVDVTAVLAELTQALRKFSVEQRKVPGALEELVVAGYLRGVPAAPAGKAFAIDARNLQVVLR